MPVSQPRVRSMSLVLSPIDRSSSSKLRLSPTLLRLGIVTLIALGPSACATTERWPPNTRSEDDSRRIAKEWIGRMVTVEPREVRLTRVSAEDQAAAESVLFRGESLHVLQLDSTTIRGATAEGVLTLPLESVQSISYRKRLATAIGGGLLGLVLGTVLGSAAARSGTYCGGGEIGGTCLVVPIAGAAAGLIVGITVGALVGYKESLIVAPPQGERSP